MTKFWGASIHQKTCHNQTYLESIPDVAKPEHEIVQGLPLIEQLPEPHCSIFLQFQDLSVKGGHKISEHSTNQVFKQLQKEIYMIITWRRWKPLIKAALATTGFLSTIACFIYRSIWERSVPSVIRQSTRMALALYMSILLFISFIRELVTMITYFKFKEIEQSKSKLVTQITDETNKSKINEKVAWEHVTSSADGDISFIIR